MSAAADYFPAALRLAAWWETQCTCDPGTVEHSKQCLVAAIFSACCEPRAGLDDEAFIAAKCCLLFFLVDDGSVDQLTTFDRFLEEGGAADPGGSEAAVCYLSLLADLGSRGCHADELTTAIRMWSAAMRAEQCLDPAYLMPQTYAVLRKETIFVSCLIQCWLALLHVAVPEDFSAECTRVTDLAIRIVILVNDLGSLRNDEEPTPRVPGALVDINSVLTRARVLGSRCEAVRQAIDEHNVLVAELRTAQQDLLLRCGHVSWAAVFLDVVRGVVGGNLRGTRDLTAQRYPGAGELLQKLDPL
ncbi:hypothetical protein [Streptomyces sp. NPDC087856]|uniref:hypothetical protein n=1 Tax=Streptomyces sp. NPDC087856 TaxID=3365811 RepID=UPI003810CD3E